MLEVARTAKLVAPNAKRRSKVAEHNRGMTTRGATGGTRPPQSPPWRHWGTRPPPSPPVAPLLNRSFSGEEKHKLRRKVLLGFSEVFEETPGDAKLVTHKIDTRDCEFIYLF